MARSRRDRDDDARKQDRALRAARAERDEQRRHENMLVEEQLRRDSIAAQALSQRHGVVDAEITRRIEVSREILAADARDAEAREAMRREGLRARAEQERLAFEVEELQRIQRDIQRGHRPQPPPR